MPESLTRRLFFRSTLESLSVLALTSQVAACAKYTGDGKLTYLNAKEAAVLLAIADTIVPKTARMPITVSETTTMARIDQFLAKGDPFASQQFRFLLTGLEHYPQLFHTSFTRMTRLTTTQRAELLVTFESSRFFAKRTIFTAVKAVICNNYFADERVKKLLKYAPACQF